MIEKERKLALYCLKSFSDYHSEVCDECVNYPSCDHETQDDVIESIIQALEQDPKSEWEHDHEILKAYSDGANEVLDKISAEIRHFMFEVNPSSSESDYACNYILDVIDKYKVESEG